MSISATSNYMSNAEILIWMEGKTNDLYGSMRDAMDTSNRRADAEAALNKVKDDIANAKNNGGDCAAIHDELNTTLAEYGDIPEVSQVLQPIADKLNGLYGTADPVNVPAPARVVDPNASWTAQLATPMAAHPFSTTPLTTSVASPPAVKTIKIFSGDADTWSKDIGDTVDSLGKKDQLGLIDIQEFNSQINQAKQTASALMDSADKSANAIISHIG
jgi:hypothetical protein